MTARDFCFWLQGFFEISGSSPLAQSLDPAQVDSVKRHLALVFAYEIDPSMGGKVEQVKLSKIHLPAGAPGNVTANGEPVMRC